MLQVIKTCVSLQPFLKKRKRKQNVKSHLEISGIIYRKFFEVLKKKKIAGEIVNLVLFR